MKVNNLEKREYELTCISPVHIGSGETLKSFEYIYNWQKQEVYFVDEARLIQFLGHRSLMDDFTVFVGEPRNKGLYNWLKSKGCVDRNMLGLSLRRAEVIPSKDKKLSLNEVHVQAALADGTPYIPGSSIKGALRTGIIYAFLQRKPELKEVFWRKLETSSHLPIREKKDRWNKALSELEETLFNHLAVEEKSSNAVNSVMRGLRISDAQCIGNKPVMVVIPKRDASLNKPIKEHDLSLYRECLPIGQKLRFSISVDYSMLSKIGISSIDEIIKMSRAYVEFGLNMQKEYFGKQYKAQFDEAQDIDMLLGGGTGFWAKTVFYALATDYTEARHMLAKYFDENISIHKHVVQDKLLTPRTLKLTLTNTDKSIMGLCQINEVK